MAAAVAIPILREFVSGGLDYGTNLLVEFEPNSLWYETSLTMTAHALKEGIRTEYHTFEHVPGEVRAALSKLGLEVKTSEEEGTLRIIDSYTVQTGLSSPEKGAGTRAYLTQSVKVSDWSIAIAQAVKTGIPETEKRWLHIDDNTSVLLQYNDEKAVIDFSRTRGIPRTRARQAVFLHSLVTGIASDSFYKQFESLCDGTIHFRSDERADEIEHYVRVRALRTRTFDSRWRRLRKLDNGEVTISGEPPS